MRSNWNDWSDSEGWNDDEEETTISLNEVSSSPVSSSYGSYGSSYLNAQDILSSGKTGSKPSDASTPSSGFRTLPGYANAPSSKAVPSSAMPKLTLPTYEAPAPFVAPERDENRLRSLRQKAAGSGVRKLRNMTQAAITSTRGLPAQVRRMTLREALRGYGEGISDVMSDASKEAQSEYNQEYAQEYNEAAMNYQGQVAASQANYATQVSAKQTQYQAELQRLWLNAKL